MRYPRQAPWPGSWTVVLPVDTLDNHRNGFRAMGLEAPSSQILSHAKTDACASPPPIVLFRKDAVIL